MVKINVGKFEEFEIGEKTYQMDLSDERLLAYQKKLSGLQNESNDPIQNIAIIKDMLNFVFGDENAGEEIYTACGRSVIFFVSAVNQIFDHV